MDLLLWRHAEAEEGTPDLKRKLTARGEKQARQMAEWIKANAPKKLRIIASPAVRAQQTAKALGLPFETDARIAPTGGCIDLLAAVGWPDGGSEGKPGGAVLVIGHQPALGRVASLLLAGEEADWTVKKGAIWWFSNRVRLGETQTVLRAVIPPDFGR
ncbi:MAG: histidine phosphatase family protein [Rhodocyclaceae bacterium]